MEESDSIEGQVKLTPFAYAITRPAPLAFQQMMQEAEYNGVSRITNGHHYFRPIYRYVHNTYEEYCNIWDLEEHPVEMIKYLKGSNFSQVIDGLEEAGRNAKKLIDLIESSKEGSLDFSKARDLFLKFKPYSIIIDDIKGVTTVCNVTTDIDPEILGEMSTYQGLFDRAAVALNLCMQSNLKKQFGEYGDLAELLTIDEVLGETHINEEELKQRENGFYLHNSELIAPEDFEGYKSKNAFNVFLKEREEEDKRIFQGVKRFEGTLHSTNRPPKIVGEARLIYSIKDFMNMPPDSIVITPMIVREWEERLGEDNILGIATDEPNENDFLMQQKRDIITGTKDATLYIEDGDYVEMSETTVKKLEKEEALGEYIDLLRYYQEQGYDIAGELISSTGTEEWQKKSIDEKIESIRNALGRIRGQDKGVR